MLRLGVLNIEAADFSSVFFRDPVRTNGAPNEDGGKQQEKEYSRKEKDAHFKTRLSGMTQASDRERAACPAAVNPEDFA